MSSTSGTSVTVRVSDHTLQQFLQSFWEFLHALVVNINDRFPSIPVLDALAVLDPRNLSPVNRLAGYGDPQIRILTDHFGQPAPKKPVIIKEEEAMSEWLLCRHLTSSTFHGRTRKNLALLCCLFTKMHFTSYHFCWLLDLFYQSQMLDVRGGSHAKIE